jgi:hypothetical protein
MSNVTRSYGSVTSPSRSLEDDLRARDRQLVALAARLPDEHGQLQLAASAHLERVGGLCGRHLDAHVAQYLAVQAQVAAHDEVGRWWCSWAAQSYPEAVA